ncbi:L,D-transpeptidase family protein [Rhizorhapis sp. SPR117]|uniref:L,D-transpeptidase family protein n=1 Tax=Rhizorhapis sp. SPR117 TaxID=2912611 RepID=UPI001F00F120|nr:L,D-transpeptidase family protein [Rhizorhapis sp. SPR117]
MAGIIRYAIIMIVAAAGMILSPPALKAQSMPDRPQPAMPSPTYWSTNDARALLDFIVHIGADGLEPADYDPPQLQAAISGGSPVAMDTVASGIFQRVAKDLMEGHVDRQDRIAWHISGPTADMVAINDLMMAALSVHRVGPALSSLLPTNPEYRALKAMLARTPATDQATVQKLRANMERWRWMPRELGEDYILINVAGFTLDLVHDGNRVARHRVIVGKQSTPTPQFSTQVTGLILNPWWNVPQSIIAESVGALVRNNPAKAKAKGYVATWTGGRLQVRQAPGPGNSLGQIKLVMPNPYTIYVHDTPAKALFERPVRAFSHGCIRTEHPFDLAQALLADVRGWDRAAIDATVASRVNTKIDLPRPIPIYVGYFTADLDKAGGVVLHDDLYGRDDLVIDALTDRAKLDEAG